MEDTNNRELSQSQLEQYCTTLSYYINETCIKVSQSIFAYNAISSLNNSTISALTSGQLNDLANLKKSLPKDNKQQELLAQIIEKNNLNEILSNTTTTIREALLDIIKESPKFEIDENIIAAFFNDSLYKELLTIWQAVEKSGSSYDKRNLTEHFVSINILQNGLKKGIASLDHKQITFFIFKHYTAIMMQLLSILEIFKNNKIANSSKKSSAPDINTGANLITKLIEYLQKFFNLPYYKLTFEFKGTEIYYSYQLPDKIELNIIRTILEEEEIPPDTATKINALLPPLQKDLAELANQLNTHTSLDLLTTNINRFNDAFVGYLTKVIASLPTENIIKLTHKELLQKSTRIKYIPSLKGKVDFLHQCLWDLKEDLVKIPNINEDQVIEFSNIIDQLLPIALKLEVLENNKKNATAPEPQITSNATQNSSTTDIESQVDIERIRNKKPTRNKTIIEAKSNLAIALLHLRKAASLLQNASSNVTRTKLQIDNAAMALYNAKLFLDKARGTIDEYNSIKFHGRQNNRKKIDEAEIHFEGNTLIQAEEYYKHLDSEFSAFCLKHNIDANLIDKNQILPDDFYYNHAKSLLTSYLSLERANRLLNKIEKAIIHNPNDIEIKINFVKVNVTLIWINSNTERLTNKAQLHKSCQDIFNKIRKTAIAESEQKKLRYSTVYNTVRIKTSLNNRSAEILGSKLSRPSVKNLQKITETFNYHMAQIREDYNKIGDLLTKQSSSPSLAHGPLPTTERTSKNAQKTNDAIQQAMHYMHQFWGSPTDAPATTTGLIGRLTFLNEQITKFENTTDKNQSEDLLKQILFAITENRKLLTELTTSKSEYQAQRTIIEAAQSDPIDGAKCTNFIAHLKDIEDKNNLRLSEYQNKLQIVLKNKAQQELPNQASETELFIFIQLQQLLIELELIQDALATQTNSTFLNIALSYFTNHLNDLLNFPLPTSVKTIATNMKGLLVSNWQLPIGFYDRPNVKLFIKEHPALKNYPQIIQFFMLFDSFCEQLTGPQTQNILIQLKARRQLIAKIQNALTYLDNFWGEPEKSISHEVILLDKMLQQQSETMRADDLVNINKQYEKCKALYDTIISKNSQYQRYWDSLVKLYGENSPVLNDIDDLKNNIDSQLTKYAIKIEEINEELKLRNDSHLFFKKFSTVSAFEEATFAATTGAATNFTELYELFSEQRDIAQTEWYKEIPQSGSINYKEFIYEKIISNANILQNKSNHNLANLVTIKQEVLDKIIQTFLGKNYKNSKSLLANIGLKLLINLSISAIAFGTAIEIAKHSAEEFGKQLINDYNNHNDFPNPVVDFVGTEMFPSIYVPVITAAGTALINSIGSQATDLLPTIVGNNPFADALTKAEYQIFIIEKMHSEWIFAANFHSRIKFGELFVSHIALSAAKISPHKAARIITAIAGGCPKYLPMEYSDSENKYKPVNPANIIEKVPANIKAALLLLNEILEQISNESALIMLYGFTVNSVYVEEYTALSQKNINQANVELAKAIDRQITTILIIAILVSLAHQRIKKNQLVAINAPSSDELNQEILAILNEFYQHYPETACTTIGYLINASPEKELISVQLNLALPDTPKLYSSLIVTMNCIGFIALKNIDKDKKPLENTLTQQQGILINYFDNTVKLADNNIAIAQSISQKTANAFNYKMLNIWQQAYKQGENTSNSKIPGWQVIHEQMIIIAEALATPREISQNLPWFKKIKLNVNGELKKLENRPSTEILPYYFASLDEWAFLHNQHEVLHDGSAKKSITYPPSYQVYLYFLAQTTNQETTESQRKLANRIITTYENSYSLGKLITATRHRNLKSIAETLQSFHKDSITKTQSQHPLRGNIASQNPNLKLVNPPLFKLKLIEKANEEYIEKLSNIFVQKTYHTMRTAQDKTNNNVFSVLAQLLIIYLESLAKYANNHQEDTKNLLVNLLKAHDKATIKLCALLELNTNEPINLNRKASQDILLRNIDNTLGHITSGIEDFFIDFLKVKLPDILKTSIFDTQVFTADISNESCYKRIFVLANEFPNNIEDLTKIIEKLSEVQLNYLIEHQFDAIMQFKEATYALLKAILNQQLNKFTKKEDKINLVISQLNKISLLDNISNGTKSGLFATVIKSAAEHTFHDDNRNENINLKLLYYGGKISDILAYKLTATLIQAEADPAIIGYVFDTLNDNARRFVTQKFYTTTFPENDQSKFHDLINAIWSRAEAEIFNETQKEQDEIKNKRMDITKRKFLLEKFKENRLINFIKKIESYFELSKSNNTSVKFLNTKHEQNIYIFGLIKRKILNIGDEITTTEYSAETHYYKIILSNLIKDENSCIAAILNLGYFPASISEKDKKSREKLLLEILNLSQRHGIKEQIEETISYVLMQSPCPALSNYLNDKTIQQNEPALFDKAQTKTSSLSKSRSSSAIFFGMPRTVTVQPQTSNKDLINDLNKQINEELLRHPALVEGKFKALFKYILQKTYTAESTENEKSIIFIVTIHSLIISFQKYLFITDPIQSEQLLKKYISEIQDVANRNGKNIVKILFDTYLSTHDKLVSAYTLNLLKFFITESSDLLPLIEQSIFKEIDNNLKTDKAYNSGLCKILTLYYFINCNSDAVTFSTNMKSVFGYYDVTKLLSKIIKSLINYHMTSQQDEQKLLHEQITIFLELTENKQELLNKLDNRNEKTLYNYYFNHIKASNKNDIKVNESFAFFTKQLDDGVNFVSLLITALSIDDYKYFDQTNNYLENLESDRLRELILYFESDKIKQLWLVFYEFDIMGNDILKFCKDRQYTLIENSFDGKKFKQFAADAKNKITVIYSQLLETYYSRTHSLNHSDPKHIRLISRYTSQRYETIFPDFGDIGQRKERTLINLPRSLIESIVNTFIRLCLPPDDPNYLAKHSFNNRMKPYATLCGKLRIAADQLKLDLKHHDFCTKLKELVYEMELASNIDALYKFTLSFKQKYSNELKTSIDPFMISINKFIDLYSDKSEAEEYQKIASQLKTYMKSGLDDTVKAYEILSYLYEQNIKYANESQPGNKSFLQDLLLLITPNPLINLHINSCVTNKSSFIEVLINNPTVMHIHLYYTVSLVEREYNELSKDKKDVLNTQAQQQPVQTHFLAPQG